MIEVSEISKRFDQHVVLSSLSLSFQDRQTHVLLGSSGCGKSTLLRIVIGLIEPNEGRVLIEGEELRQIPSDRRRQLFGYVIQKASLYPHLSARNNVCLPARAAGWTANRQNTRIEELAELVQLEPSLLQKFPVQLSGGQQQRVSIMRALMLNPPFLLMDEPLSALDPIIRSDLQSELKTIFRKLEKTVIFVTHDLKEADQLGDEIYLLNSGRIEQQGQISDLRKNPATEFVKKFVSSQSMESTS